MEWFGSLGRHKRLLGASSFGCHPPSMPAATALTVKQRRLVKHYLETGNGTEAAMVAYDVADRNTARSIGTENLRKPNRPGFSSSLA